jgi:hypothetical protein
MVMAALFAARRATQGMLLRRGQARRAKSPILASGQAAPEKGDRQRRSIIRPSIDADCAGWPPSRSRAQPIAQDRANFS